MADCFVRGYDPDAAEKQGVKKTLTDRLIQLRSKLTHSEFQFSQRYGSVSFSFTLADHVKGARFKKITYTHPTRWEVARFTRAWIETRKLSISENERLVARFTRAWIETIVLMPSGNR